jgi:hypothetical protein
MQALQKKNYDNTSQQIMKKKLGVKKIQRFLLNFGALSSNLFLDFSRHVRLLR